MSEPQRRIALYHDVGAFPLWYMDDDGREIANVGPHGRGLPLSDDLRAALEDWAQRWDSNLDDDYDIADDTIADQLCDEAHDLKRRLVEELGPSFTVL